VVITEADKLSKDAQHALRRIMEKYMSNCRYILCCNITKKGIFPLRSRCLSVRVAAPSLQEVWSFCSARLVDHRVRFKTFFTVLRARSESISLARWRSA
jgi:hypothetical protein